MPLDFNTENLTQSCNSALCRSIEIENGLASLKTRNNFYFVSITFPVAALIPYIMLTLCKEIPVADVMDARCNWITDINEDYEDIYVGKLGTCFIDYCDSPNKLYLELNVAGRNYISFTEEVALFYIELLKEKTT